jgi:hypothetical protein
MSISARTHETVYLSGLALHIISIFNRSNLLNFPRHILRWFYCNHNKLLRLSQPLVDKNTLNLSRANSNHCHHITSLQWHFDIWSTNTHIVHTRAFTNHTHTHTHTQCACRCSHTHTHTVCMCMLIQSHTHTHTHTYAHPPTTMTSPCTRMHAHKHVDPNSVS